MWLGTLRGDDIRRADAELKRQRAAIQAHYDYEMKRLETKIADLEAFERSIVNFLTNYKVEDGSLATVADLGPPAEEVTGAAGLGQATWPMRAPALASEQSELNEIGAPLSNDRRKTARNTGIWTPSERALFTGRPSPLKARAS